MDFRLKLGGLAAVGLVTAGCAGATNASGDAAATQTPTGSAGSPTSAPGPTSTTRSSTAEPAPSTPPGRDSGPPCGVEGQQFIDDLVSETAAQAVVEARVDSAPTGQKLPGVNQGVEHQALDDVRIVAGEPRNGPPERLEIVTSWPLPDEPFLSSGRYYLVLIDDPNGAKGTYQLARGREGSFVLTGSVVAQQCPDPDGRTFAPVLKPGGSSDAVSLVSMFDTAFARPSS